MESGFVDDDYADYEDDFEDYEDDFEDEDEEEEEAEATSSDENENWPPKKKSIFQEKLEQQEKVSRH